MKRLVALELRGVRVFGIAANAEASRPPFYVVTCAVADDAQGHAGEEWWLMDCAFPDLIWARIRPARDGAAEVLEAGGKTLFPTMDAAVSYLCEDEYTPLVGLIEEEETDEFSRQRLGRSFKDVVPPSASTEDELIGLLVQRSSTVA
jgi:hypothetical protein